MVMGSAAAAVQAGIPRDAATTMADEPVSAQPCCVAFSSSAPFVVNLHWLVGATPNPGEGSRHRLFGAVRGVTRRCGGGCFEPVPGKSRSYATAITAGWACSTIGYSQGLRRSTAVSDAQGSGGRCKPPIGLTLAGSRAGCRAAAQSPRCSPWPPAKQSSPGPPSHCSAASRRRRVTCHHHFLVVLVGLSDAAPALILMHRRPSRNGRVIPGFWRPGRLATPG
jgi:hypothetical protein